MNSSLFGSVSSETHGAISSVMMNIGSIPNSSSTSSVIPLLNIVDGITNENDHDLPGNTKRISPRTILMNDLSHRLLRRKEIHNRL